MTDIYWLSLPRVQLVSLEVLAELDPLAPP